MKRALTIFLAVFTLLAAIASGPVHAASLDELRASGAIGERYDGYVVVRSNVSGAADIAAKVNAERRRIYEQRAAQQKISPVQVGQVYAAQIIGSAPAGTYFQAQDGSWKRK